MVKPVLHYIYDPYCGWCYGASPLINAAMSVAGGKASFMLHGGGLFAGANRRPITAEFRRYVQVHDQRIAGLSAQVFGQAYQENLLHNENLVLDSAIPIAAIEVAQLLAGQGYAMLQRIQISHYVAGLNVADSSTLTQLARALGIDGDSFARHLAVQLDDGQHIHNTQQFMQRLQVRGYPSLILEADRNWQTLEVSRYYGKVPEFSDYLQSVLTEFLPVNT